MSFVYPLRPGWYDLMVLATAVYLFVFDTISLTVGAVLVILVVAAQFSRRSSVTRLTPVGVSLPDRGRPVVPWPSVERIEAVQGLLGRYVRLTVRGRRPMVLPTPVATRLGSATGFDAAVAEFARWAAAYGDHLTVTPVTLSSRRASRLVTVGLAGVGLGALVANVILRAGPHKHSTAGAVVIVVAWLVSLIAGLIISRVEQNRR